MEEKKIITFFDFFNFFNCLVLQKKYYTTYNHIFLHSKDINVSVLFITPVNNKIYTYFNLSNIRVELLFDNDPENGFKMMTA